ncbi:MAG TPA: YjgN family protein [Candidatus Didemnitutus sp.]|nr:YjgN family protein [Candidatus Didemnitutus sp.]
MSESPASGESASTPFPESLQPAPISNPEPASNLGRADLPPPGGVEIPANPRPEVEAALVQAAQVTEPPPLAQPKLESFTFHGKAEEYFRIWIVNTLLTLLTCGVFAAWAKVRRRRYLRGNTELMGHRFDYRADPRRILVGNIVVMILFLSYVVVGKVYPVALFVTLGVALVLLPWIVVRSLAFNAHNTAYRGMRFYFHQTYGMAAMTYIGQALAIPFTLGFYYPAWIRNRREFVIANHRLGDAFFRFKAGSGPFYLAYLVGGGMIFAAAMLGGVITSGILAGTKHKVADLMELLPFFALYGFTIYMAKHYIYAQLFNHVWNHTQLDDHRFVATMQTGRWLGLQLGNLGAMIVSCGLLYPWAMVRSARYALSCLQFQPAGPIEKISKLGGDEGSALGETTGEFIGLDFGL